MKVETVRVIAVVEFCAWLGSAGDSRIIKRIILEQLELELEHLIYMYLSTYACPIIILTLCVKIRSILKRGSSGTTCNVLYNGAHDQSMHLHGHPRAVNDKCGFPTR